MSNQTLTQIDPHNRRRRVPAAHERVEPLGLELAEAVAEADEDQPDEDGCFSHPPHSYTDPTRPRWNLPLCLLEKVKPSKVRKWDSIEDGLEVSQRRIYIEKSTGTQRWADVYDVRREATDDCADLTLDWLRELAGPGIYRVWIYNVSLVGEHRTPFQTKTRCFNVEPFSRAVAAPAQPARQAPPPAPAPPASPPPSFPAMASPTLPGMPAGLPAMPPPATAQEWMQMAQIAQQLALTNQQAEEARRRAAAEDDERKARSRREDLEHQTRLAALEDDRRAREAQRRRDEAAARRDEDDSYNKQLLALRSKITELSTQQVGQAANATKPPDEQIAEAVKMMERLEELVGKKREAEVSGVGGQVVTNLAAAVAQPQNMQRILEFIGTVATNQQALAEMRLDLERVKMQAPPTNDPGVVVQHVPPHVPRIVVAPPPPVVQTSTAAPLPEPGGEVLTGDPCPECGKPVPGCIHYPAEEGDEPADADEGCELCPECPHEDDQLDPTTGDCRACGPCPHVQAVLVPAGDAPPAP